MTIVSEHDHRWVKVSNSLAEVCQVCHWLFNPVTGEIEPPNLEIRWVTKGWITHPFVLFWRLF
jgi:hypothetical protein